MCLYYAEMQEFQTSFVKLTTVFGKICYYNLARIAYYDPTESEVVLMNGDVIVIDPEKSDVAVFTGISEDDGKRKGGK